MKNLLPLACALALFGCTTAQLNTAETIALPIAEATAVATGAYFGVPPTATIALEGAVNSLWGAYQQAQAGQPVAQGAISSTIGNAITASIPAGTTQSAKIVALQQAANILTAQAAK